jgi:hypothetical protein
VSTAMLRVLGDGLVFQGPQKKRLLFVQNHSGPEGLFCVGEGRVMCACS